MLVDVRLQVIDFRLLVVAEIAQSQGQQAAGLVVERQLLAQVRGRDEGGGHDVVVVVATREYLVVRLPVVRAEHNAYQRKVQLVIDSPMAFP